MSLSFWVELNKGICNDQINEYDDEDDDDDEETKFHSQC